MAISPGGIAKTAITLFRRGNAIACAKTEAHAIYGSNIMTKTDDALASQALLLNKFSEIIRNLIAQLSATQTARDNALAQIATLLGADDATASAILADSPHIQSLIDEANAALPVTSLPSDTLAAAAA
jgi:hypothetical protein